jgi:diguanylate cyclase (GGDEF)-like protein
MSAWRLSTRFAAQSIGLLLLVQLASFGVIHSGIERNARGNLSNDLAQGELIWNRLIEQRAQKLTQGASILAADYGFKSAVGSGDTNTMASALENHGARIGASFVAMLDTQQAVQAQAGEQPDAVAQALPAVLNELTQHGQAVAVVGRSAYQFVMVPMKAPVLMGWVVMGFPLDADVLADMKAVTGLEVVLLAHGETSAKALLSTLPPTLAQEAALQPDTQMTLDNEPQQGRLISLDEHGALPAQARVNALLLGSIAQAVAPYQQVQVTLAIITAAGLGLFGLGAVLTARRVAQPLQDLVGASNALALGRYETVPSHTGLSDEVGDLARAFDRMRLSIAGQQKEIRQLAYWDRLTGLPNREQFRDTLQASMAAEQPLAVLMLDLDRLKHVNDVLGYSVGDRLLQGVAERLSMALTPPQVLARVGGDEFAILVPGCDASTAMGTALAVMVALETPLVIDEQTIDLAAGVGVACWPEHGRDVDTLLSRVEMAMYAAKKDTHVPLLYDSKLDASSSATLSLISELRQAIDLDELRLYLQPKIDLRTGQVVGAEALVRWQHSTKGLVPPMAFIPYAEQTGFIRHLTQWIFEACARQQHALAAVGVARVSVNLSTRDLLDKELPEKFARLLARHGSAAQHIKLEITESAIMDDPQRAEMTLNRLADAGFGLSIDDFGTGYSSLAYLKRLPVHELKIDQSFVKGMAQSEGDAKIVRSTIDLAHNLGLQVVAEGVETQQIADSLASMACDEAQGYLYCKPLPVGDFIQWAKQWGAQRSPPEDTSTVPAPKNTELTVS